jgi:hypothetical protein
MRIGSKYDKRQLYFYNLDFADDLEKSFQIAESFYKQALPYWEKAKGYALIAHRYPFEINLPTIETKRFSIAKGELDFQKIIGNHLRKLSTKMTIVKQFLDKEGKPRPVKEWMKKADDPKLEKELEELYQKGLKEMKIQ